MSSHAGVVAGVAAGERRSSPCTQECVPESRSRSPEMTKTIFAIHPGFRLPRVGGIDQNHVDSTTSRWSKVTIPEIPDDSGNSFLKRRLQPVVDSRMSIIEIIDDYCRFPAVRNLKTPI